MVVGRTICVLLAAASVHGADFLGAQHHASEEPISRQEVESTFLAELNSNDETISLLLEMEMRPLFDTMEKNEHGNLEPSSVRYVLHRYFAQKHGWHMIGLDRAAGAWNSSAPTAILKNQVPTYVEDIFEKQLASKGLGLKDLTVLVATLMDLVTRESLNELDYIFNAYSFNRTSLLTEKDLKRAFRGFLVAKIWGIEPGNALQNLKNGENALNDNYLGWSETKMWESDEIETFKFFNSRLNPFVTGIPFDTAVSMAETLNHRHSQFHFLQCRSLKNKLLELEHKGSGRVPLGRFYSGGHKDDWPFVEKKEYLREIGVLDESDPKRPSVIIQNYLLGPSNCLETSGYYSLCCRDECEDILAQVEAAVEKPSAIPQAILEIVSTIGSETVHAPRNLSVAHSSRLEDIAAHHGGQVPLHGRLFAQWLHHVYPQECAFPHAAGTVSHQTPDDWAASKGFQDANADVNEMRNHRKTLSQQSEATLEALPWTAVEELVSSRRVGEPKSNGALTWWSSLRMAVLVAAMASLAYSMSLAASDGLPQKKSEHLV